MMRVFMSVLSFVGVLMVAAAGAGAQEDFEWSRLMERGQTLEVRGIYGDIRAVRAEGERAVVTARKRGHQADFGDVQIEVIEAHGRVVVCVLHDLRGRGNPCDLDAAGDPWGGQGRHHTDMSVDFEVSFPAGVEFIGSVVLGDVDVRDVASEARPEP